MRISHYLQFKSILILGLFTLVKVNAQTSISLLEAYEIAEEKNLNKKINQKALGLAQKNYAKSKAIFLPQIVVSHTAIGTTNPLMAFGSKLNQEILTQQDFNPNMLNDPDYIRNYTTKIQVQQPLINVDGIYERKAAQLHIDIQNNQNKFKDKHLKLEIKKAYMQLQVAIKQVSVLEKAKETAHANLNFANNHFKQGYLTKSDLLEVEVRVSDVDNQLYSAKNQVLNASNFLSHLLNLPLSETLIPADLIELEINQFDSLYALPKQREDIDAMDLGYAIQKKLLQSSKMKFLPRLNLFGHIELHDDQIFGTEAKGYIIGAQLSWDIFKGGSQWADIQKNKIEVEKTALNIELYKEQSQLEINKTIRHLSDINNRLIQSSKSVIQSKEALKIRTNRFEQGLEKTTDLLRAESLYAQKQLEYINTVFNYNFTVAYLKLLINQD